LRGEFDIADTWLGYEIHPETPPEGADVSGWLDSDSREQMTEMLHSRSAELGLPYAPAPILANSRLALAAAEYARDQGRFPEFHKGMLEAVFTHGRNIGEREEIAKAAKRAGLDAEETLRSIDENRYQEQLKQAAYLGRQLGITGVPTFIVNSRYKIVGAQSLDIFREIFRKAEGSEA